MKRLLILFCALSLISPFMLSCASNWTKNNGSVSQDDDIKAMFETHEYDSKYKYFYNLGRWNRSPVAIAGVDKDYVLVKESNPSDFSNWQQFEPGNEKLNELVRTMDKPTSNNYSSAGFIIYASGGEGQIGIMYNVSRFGSNKPEIRFKGENQIVVIPSTGPGAGGAP